MKCIHCGANYKTMELECPYCHAPNPKGREWLKERNKAENKYKRERINVINKGTPYIVSRIIMYIAITMVTFSVISFLAVVAFFIREEFKSVGYVSRSEALEQMEKYYNNGEYLELYFYMSEKDLFDEEYYVYSQAALLTNKYHLYQSKKMSMLKEIEDGVMDDDYYVSYTLSESIEIYKVDVGVYDEEVSENQAIYDMYREEIMSFWVGTLGLTEEEIEWISDKENYLYFTDEQELTAKIIERGIKQ
ncbi:MAG: hypothetical protein E7270_05095 [Lachnospiraceae bacterium]|nr:hypothetical protein [Lachnospiraceae bacterium]